MRRTLDASWCAVPATAAGGLLRLTAPRYKELLEDIHDLTIIAERKDEPTISLDELKKKLKAARPIHDSVTRG